MGTRNGYGFDWIRTNQTRYLSDDAPSAVMDAVSHILAARAALEVGELEVAEFMYKGAQKLWREMETADPGHWVDEIAATGQEIRKLHHRHH